MNRFAVSLAIAVFGLATLFCAEESTGQQPGWSPNIIATGQERDRIRATPIEQRPYRPMHLYGNTVRRLHYRGTPLPTIAETVALPARVVIRR
ncbi:MAG TPA: hypothetical protein DDZ51_05380 [Planctomycetaceae bacterium]|nr:hypothetical protein [Planctomycetaceae bacterium]